MLGEGNEKHVPTDSLRELERGSWRERDVAW
jgi:hypothetical protein